MKKKTILIIDDEITLQKPLTEILIQEGFCVKSAFDGEAGVEMAKKISPDLIILDIIMPKMNGAEVFKRISSNRKNKTPILILSNLEESREVKKMLKMGVSNYLIKSNYSLEGIVEKIKSLL